MRNRDDVNDVSRKERNSLWYMSEHVPDIRLEKLRKITTHLIRQLFDSVGL
jgi:hypothetical protein